MIFYLHTPNLGGGMCGSDHVPRIGEKLRVDTDIVPEQNGLFEVQDVLYGIPCSPDRQRIDVYAIKRSDLPKDLSYSEVIVESLKGKP